MSEAVQQVEKKDEPVASGYRKGSFSDSMWVECVIWSMANGKPCEVPGRLRISRPASGDVDACERKIATHRPEGDTAFELATKVEFLSRVVREVDRQTFADFPESGDLASNVAAYFADEPLWVEAYYAAVGLLGAPRIYFR